MEYQYIVNPRTNRKCRVDSGLGKRIIKTYLNQYGGSSDKKMKDFPNTFKFVKKILDTHPNVHRGAKIQYDELQRWVHAERQVSDSDHFQMTLIHIISCFLIAFGMESSQLPCC